MSAYRLATKGPNLISVRLNISLFLRAFLYHSLRLWRDRGQQSGRQTHSKDLVQNRLAMSDGMRRATSVKQLQLTRSLIGGYNRSLTKIGSPRVSLNAS